MNKVALFSALFFSVCGLSDLRLEIKKGTIDPINIAIYEINDKSNISKTITITNKYNKNSRARPPCWLYLCAYMFEFRVYFSLKILE